MYIEKMSVELESLVGTLIAGIRVPPPGKEVTRPDVVVPKIGSNYYLKTSINNIGRR